MIADLHLKGNELLVFALIHGYTKDGKSKCRVSLNYMANWLCTDKSMVIKVINTLEKAGYVNRHEYFEGKVRNVEYTTNYEALLEKVANGVEVSLQGVKKSRGVKITPTSECTQMRGCQNDTGVKMTTKGCQNDHKSGVKITPNNNNIIIYNNFYCAEPAQQEEEKKNFYIDFFFRNAADPTAEVEKFIAYNNSLQWRNEKGRVYETPEQRLSLARLWEFKAEGQWARPDYLKVVKEIYQDACNDGIDGVEVMINHKVNLVWDGRQNKWFWKVTPEVREWVVKNSALVHKHLDPVTAGRTVTWEMIKAS